MLSWKSLTAWAISALMFASPSQGSEIIDSGSNKCIAVDYDGSAIDTSIVSVYKEYSDCTMDEGGSFSASSYSSDYSRCFRDKDGSNNRIWNTGCGWEIGYRNSDDVWVAVARSNDILVDGIDCSTSGWTDLTLWTWYDASSGAYVDRLHTGYGSCYKFPRPDKSTTTSIPGTTNQGTDIPGTTGGTQPGTSNGGTMPATSNGGTPPATSNGGTLPATSSGGTPPATSNGGTPPATSSGGTPPATSGATDTTTTTAATDTTTSTASGTTTTSGTTVYTTVTEWQINVTIVTTNGDLLTQCADGDSSIVGPIVEESLTTVLNEYSSDFTLESVSATFENCEDGNSGDVHTLVWMFKVTVTATVSVSDGTTFDSTAFGTALQTDISGSAFTDELNLNLLAIYSGGDTTVSGAGVSMDNISVQADKTNGSASKTGFNKELYLLIGIIAAVVIAAIAIIYGIVRYHNRRKQADDDVLITDTQAGRIASLSADGADPLAIGVVGGTTATGAYGETNQPQTYQNYNNLAYVQPVVTDAPGKFLVMGGAVPPAPALPGSYANNTETTHQNQSGEQESDEEPSVPQATVGN